MGAGFLLFTGKPESFLGLRAFMFRALVVVGFAQALLLLAAGIYNLTTGKVTDAVIRLVYVAVLGILLYYGLGLTAIFLISGAASAGSH